MIRRPQPVPKQYAGKWVAWTPNGVYALAAGSTPEEARIAAEARRPDPTIGWVPEAGVAYEWVPPANDPFIGTPGV